MAQDQSALLEELKSRHQAAQARLQEATQAFQQAQQTQVAAQAAFQKAQQTLVNAQQQFHGWNVAMSTVAAEEAARKQAAKQAQLELPNTPSSTLAPSIQAPTQPEHIEAPERLNKTELIRALLAESPQGMAPTEIWHRVRDQFKYRAYMYSVLKRLTEREEISVGRGKYRLRMKPVQEVKEPTATIQ
jgi:DNA repair exonuclease SbcCD ATPase subunit